MVINGLTNRTPPAATPEPSPPAADSIKRRQELPPAGAPAPVRADAAAQGTDVQQVVSKLSEYIQTVQRDLHFSVDEESGQTVVKVIDSATDKVIRQIPPEDVIAFAQVMNSVSGLLFDTKV